MAKKNISTDNTAFMQLQKHLSKLDQNKSLKKPVVLFVDDDGFSAVLTTYAPLFESKSVPFNTAVYSNSAIITDPVKLAQLVALQNSGKCEVLSHGYSHTALNTLTEAQVIAECENHIAMSVDKGLNVESIVYPYGGITIPYIQIISKYYRSGFVTAGSFYNDMDDIYTINRCAVGNSMPVGKDTLEYLKAQVDLCLANKNVLTFMTHCGSSNGMLYVPEIIDYVLSLGIEIMTVSDMLDIHGAVISSPDYQVKKNGAVFDRLKSSNINITARAETDAPSLVMSTNMYVFKASGWSVGTGNGVVYEQNTSGTATQIQIFIDTYGMIFERRWSGSVWKKWVQMAYAKSVVSYACEAVTVNANSIVEKSISDTSFIQTDSHIAQPTGVLEAGLIWQCYSAGNGACRLLIYNTTAANISAAARTWKISRFLTSGSY